MKNAFHSIILLLLIFCTTIDTAEAQKITPVAKVTEPVVTKNSSDEELTLALVVGVSKYRNSRLNLNYAHKDAIDFDNFLQSKVGGSVPKENIFLLTDTMATSSQIYRHLEKILVRVKKEVKAKKLRIVLFFSMHGGALKDSVGKVEDGYLLTYDTDEKVPKQSSVQFSKLHQFEQSFLQRENTKVEVYIDACRAGLNVGLNFDKLPVTELLRNWDNVLRIVSCSPHESSYEREKGENGIFTYYLIKGLSGFADTEEDGVKDGKINAIELLTYFKKNIKEELGKEKKQTPRIWGNNEEQPLAVLPKGNEQLEQLAHTERFASSDKVFLENKTFSKLNVSDYDSIIAINYYLKGTVLYDSHGYMEALECFRKAIAIKSDFAEAYHFTGVVLTNLIRNEDALEAFNKAISLKPDYKVAYLGKGIVLTDLKRYYEALITYDKVTAMVPDYAEAYYNKGFTLNNLNRKEEALEAYEKVIAMKPDYTNAYIVKGLLLEGLNRKDEALNAYDKAIDLKPNYAIAYLYRGLVLEDLNRKYEALEAFDKAIALQPDYVEAYFDKGILLKRLNHKEEALNAYDKVIELKPDYKAYNNKGILLKDLNRKEEALKAYDKAIALNPYDAYSYNNRGVVLQELNHKDEALAAFDKAIELKPDYADAYHNKGNVLNELDRKEDALNAYDKAITIKPDAETYFEKGEVLKGLNRKKESLQAYDNAIALKPDHIMYYNIGHALFTFNLKEEALNALIKSIELKPDYANAYFGKGYVLDALNRKAEALIAYDKAIELKPNHIDAYYNKGLDLIALGRIKNALETFLTYLTIVPNDAKVIKLCAQLAYYNKQPLISIKYWNQYLQLQPNDIDAWNGLGGCYLSEKNYNHSKENFEKSIALNPKQQSPYYNLSCLYSLQNQSKEALSYLEQALQKGYTDFAHIKEDTDLDNIRALPAFRELLKKYQK